MTSTPTRATTPPRPDSPCPPWCGGHTAQGTFHQEAWRSFGDVQVRRFVYAGEDSDTRQPSVQIGRTLMASQELRDMTAWLADVVDSGEVVR